jgi:DNA helicase-2/ATP-dependent DNA helicase PcrA
LRRLYGGAAFAELTKSYRSTCEIISLARRIKATGTMDATLRHGEAPAIIGCADRQEEFRHIRSGIDAFQKSGYASLGIITKTNGDAKRLSDMLLADYDVHLLSPESARFENGVTVTSIQMSKGLEFDEVMIPCADAGQYSTEYDRSLLYIACTRAMHRLTLLYIGQGSSFIKEVEKNTQK